MNANSPLLHEVRELRLLARGLSQIEAFPKELLELMVSKIDHLEGVLLQDQLEPSPEAESILAEQPIVTTAPITTAPTTEAFTSDLSADSDGCLERIKVALTLNDRFLFQRELFGNDPRRMAAFFGDLSRITSRSEATIMLRTSCPGCEQTEGFATLTNLLEQWFPAHPGIV